ncbi:MAG TPA: hypothetical protein DEP69_00480, partial [Acidimicrobiaceae bacterium]|nr:hypothetical protein [Acidimicrobiaceae bacterium]
MTHPEIESEQAYITRAHELLEDARVRATRLRSMVEVGRGGTRQALYERDVIEESVANRLAKLELGPSSLVFGRTDHLADDEADADGTAGGARTYYIGRVAVADEHQESVVVDWRARIAEPFFRASAREPLGLLRRRHFVTRGAKLLDVEDEIFALDEFFGEDDRPRFRAHGALYAAMAERRGTQMRDVVATIQADQDEIVRSPLPGVLVLQGGPGTGKTVVALHRAAYLLYTHRFPLAGQGVLVLGPNRLFLRYIERVLPSLGEVGAHLFVTADLFNDLFPDVRVRLADSTAAATTKGSEKMSQVLAAAVADRQRPLRGRLRVPFRASYLTLAPHQSREIVAAAQRRFRHHNAARRFVENSVFETLAAAQRLPAAGTG